MERCVLEAAQTLSGSGCERLAAERVALAAVWSSRWCRAQETAALLAAGYHGGAVDSTAAATAVANLLRDQPAFDSFFADAREAPDRTAAAQALLLRWLAYRGDRGTALVVVTHQVNITALCGVYPASGEGVVLRRAPASSGASAVGAGTAAGRPGPQLLVVGRVLP